MGIATRPSKITLPWLEPPYPTILEFLTRRFSRIEESVWRRRISAGKVLDEEGAPVTELTAYQPQRNLYYYREVAKERVIPFAEEVLFQNDHLLVCCKPHFLPVTPGGVWVEECLLHRLRKSTGIEELTPLHRIDRDTAGLVMFSVNRRTTALYGRLFFEGKVEKVYEAIAAAPGRGGGGEWLVENRIEPGEPWFRMQVVPGRVNARSRITLVERREGDARFQLSPLTGKTHQLRLHMSSLGLPILNDRLYPELSPQGEDDFSRPLKLLAQSVRFKDPVTQAWLEFHSTRELDW